MLSEEHGRGRVERVKFFEEGVSVFGERGGEHDYFVVLAHAGDELLAEGPFEHVHVADFALDFHREDDVWVVDGLE